MQKALSSAIKHLRRSKPRRLWDWSCRMRKPLGAALRMGTAVAHAPWAIKAIAYGLYTAAKICVGVVLP